MYDFTNLNKNDNNTSINANTVAPEAITVDGVTLDQAIDGFTTLQVTGRELLGYTLTSLKVGNQDGECLEEQSRPTRTITVKYQLKADTPQKFRSQFYQLNQILGGKDKRLTFADDPDKYFIGTLSDVDTPDGGKLAVVSSFSFTCFDPYCYASDTDTFSFSDKAAKEQVEVDFNGKITGNLSPVPHTIFKGFALGAGATQEPSYYTQELSQDEYSKLAGLDNSDVILDGVNDTQYSVSIQQPKTDVGALETVAISGTKLHVKGYFIEPSSTWRKYAYIVVEKEFGEEVGRVKVDLQQRTDIQALHKKEKNSLLSGFEGDIDIVDGMLNQNLKISLRYTDDANGDGNYKERTTIIPKERLWKYQTPHFVVKFDVRQAFEQFEKGFYSKYGIAGKIEQLNYIKANLQSADVAAYGFGTAGNAHYFAMQVYNPTTKTYTDALTHDASDNSLLDYSFKNADDFFNYIDSDGYLYLDIYAKTDASISKLNLDYIKLSMLVDLPSSDTLTVTNDGTQPVPIDFKIVNHNDNGFISIADSKHSYLFGNVSESDGTTSTSSEMIVTRDATNANGLKQWAINDGVINDWNANAVQQGAFEDPATIKEKRWRLRNAQGGTAAWGSGSSAGTGWHGPSASLSFSSDKAIKNFTARFYAQFLFKNMKKHGLQNFTIFDTNKKILVSVQLYKWFGVHSSLKIRIGDVWAYIDERNPRWDNFFGQIVIQKMNGNYTITLENIEGSGQKTKQVVSYVDAVSADSLAGGMTYWKAVWGNNTSGNVMNNDLYDFWMRKDNVTKYTDIPNLLKEGDKLNISMGGGKVVTTLNGGSALKYQDIGSRPLIAYPGQNAITFNYSSFASRPDVTATIRRKYL